MNRRSTGKDKAMDESGASVDVEVTAQDAHAAEITLTGELTEGARRPLVRTMTDLLLGAHQLRRVQLDTRPVTFLNSAGLSTLVQVQKMCQPRGIELALVVGDDAVTRPLQLSGLWHRFTVVDRRPDVPADVHEATPRPREHS
jgi:stage II sporulation protein AA (anti-sigma F factor antagonist)